MSKIRNLPESTSLSPSDLVYVVDVSEGPNAGRKSTVATLKQAVIADASEIPYDNTNSTLTATDVRNAIDELDSKHNDHSGRHGANAIDGLSTAAPVTSDADGNNNIGTADSYSRSDHKHNILTGTPISQAPDQTNNAGSANSLAKSDHRHNIPTDAPTTSLSPATTNDEGTGSSFSRNDHTHAIATALVSDITTIQPDAAAAAGTANTYARGDHRHAIDAAAASSINTSSTNTEGSSTSFARADHTHAVSITNSEATATADDTTTSLTDVLIVGMTLTPASGTYLVMFSGSVLNSNNGAERTFVSLYSGGIQAATTERSAGVAGGAYVPVATQAILTVNGSQAIEARWRVAGGTSTIHSRRLTLLKVG